MSEQPVVLSMTTDKPCVPNCTVGWCAICGAEVWISPDTAHLEARRICQRCSPGMLAATGDVEFRITKETRAALHAQGFSDAEINRTMQKVNRLYGVK